MKPATHRKGGKKSPKNYNREEKRKKEKKLKTPRKTHIKNRKTLKNLGLNKRKHRIKKT